MTGALRDEEPRVRHTASLVRLLEWAAVAFLAWKLAAAIPVYLQDQSDFKTYFYPAASMLIGGQSPYEFLSPWGDRYMYPPWFALMLAPLTPFSPDEAAVLWMAANLAALVVAVVLASRLCGVRLGIRRLALASLLLANWLATGDHLGYGQHALVPGAFALATIWLLREHRPWLAGLLFVGVASKPQLALLLGIGLTAWSWRTTRTLAFPVAFAIGVGAVSLLCLAIAPDWLVDYARPWPEPNGVPISVRLLLITHFGHSPLVEYLSLAIVAAGSVAMMYFGLRERSIVIVASAALAATFLVLPHTQMYDFVVLVLPFFVILRGSAPRSISSQAATVGVLILAAWLLVSVDRWFHHWIEDPSVWAWLSGWLGDEAVGEIYWQSEWNWRFIAMLLPLMLVVWLAVLRRSRVRSAAPSPDAEATTGVAA